MDAVVSPFRAGPQPVAASRGGWMTAGGQWRRSLRGVAFGYRGERSGRRTGLRPRCVALPDCAGMAERDAARQLVPP